jgi:hypothetical protein
MIYPTPLGPPHHWVIVAALLIDYEMQNQSSPHVGSGHRGSSHAQAVNERVGY